MQAISDFLFSPVSPSPSDRGSESRSPEKPCCTPQLSEKTDTSPVHAKDLSRKTPRKEDGDPTMTSKEGFESLSQLFLSNQSKLLSAMKHGNSQSMLENSASPPSEKTLFLPAWRKKSAREIEKIKRKRQEG